MVEDKRELIERIQNVLKELNHDIEVILPIKELSESERVVAVIDVFRVEVYYEKLEDGKRTMRLLRRI